MRLFTCLILGIALIAPRAFAQSLPDLGGPGDAGLSPALERRIGESIVHEIRTRDPAYIDDPELAEYLGNLGARLTQVMAGARYDFEFFVVRDASVNAFALPGGFVGVHTGLITMADTESELASVLAHEAAHVTQRHIARMFGQQQQMQMPMMVALAAAILLGRSRPDLASGAAAAAQAGAVQSQLNYTRDFEREADRVGLQALNGAGFDARAMAVFFEKMQRSMRVSEDSTVPSYLRSHPVTFERIADAQNRSSSMPYRQHLDTAEFHFVRPTRGAYGGHPGAGVRHFEGLLREGRYLNEAAAHYGLASALLRARRPADADAQVARLRAAGGSGAMVETLAARVKQAAGQPARAATLLTDARARYPQSRPVLYAYVEALQTVSKNDEALATLSDALRLHRRDPRLYSLLARTYAALGKRLLQHQAQAELYALQGSLPAAIEQLQLARSSGDGDFYQLSVVDARLKDLRAQHAIELRDPLR
jgi:predicted Zn-dependent protease